MRIRISAVVTLVVVSACASVLRAPSVASGAVTPCGNVPEHYFAGTETSGTTQWGAKADIVAQEPVLCGNTSWSSAWSMDSACPCGTGSSWNYWAQVGYARNGVNTVGGGGVAHYQVFTQWVPANNNLAPVTNWWGGPAGVANYETSYNFSEHRVNMWAAGTQLTHTSYDPMNYWATPWQAVFMGETFHCESDLPGTATNKVKFSSINKKLSDGTWSQISNLLLPNPSCSSRYHEEWVTQPSSFRIWTYPLS